MPHSAFGFVIVTADAGAVFFTMLMVMAAGTMPVVMMIVSTFAAVTVIVIVTAAAAILMFINIFTHNHLSPSPEVALVEVFGSGLNLNHNSLSSP